MGPSWSWSYGGWIYNYLCNQCISPLTLWVRSNPARGNAYSIQHHAIKSGFLRILWFHSPIKTDRHDITQKSSNVALSTITPTPPGTWYITLIRFILVIHIDQIITVWTRSEKQRRRIYVYINTIWLSISNSRIFHTSCNLNSSH